VWLITRRTIHDFIADRCTQMAAALAYYVLFSIIPMVALAVAAFGLVLRVPQIRQSVVDSILRNVPVQAGLVVDAIRAVSSASEPLTILGALTLVWTTMNMFGAIRDSLNVAWGVRKGRPLFRQKLIDLGIVIGLGLLLGASVLGTTALHTLRNVSALVLGQRMPRLEYVWDVFAWAFPAAITFVAFLLLYRYVPNVRHRFSDVWPGALLAALLFEMTKHAFTFYVASFSRFEMLYGALGAVMLFLMWVYLSAMILLLGAEMAAVYERAIRGRTTAARPLPDLVFQPRPEPASPAVATPAPAPPGGSH
jgi:membrane protein